jgi:hypothetical protein
MKMAMRLWSNSGAGGVAIITNACIGLIRELPSYFNCPDSG